MEASYNTRCPAVKRLLCEAKELHEATEEYFAQPLEDNLFEWHFTFRGPPETEFDGGIYHGRIIMPADYPMKPPDIIFLTPNGRFETSKKICLSISGHHPETWQPSWSIRTALMAIIGFMPTPAKITIGSLDYTAQERAVLARKSQSFDCTECGCVAKLLKDRTGDNKDFQKEAREMMGQVSVAAKVEGKAKSESTADGAAAASSSDAVDGASTDSPNSPDETSPATEGQGGTSQGALSGSNASLPEQQPAPEGAPEIIMEGATPRNNSRSPVSNLGNTSSSGYLYNTVLSAAIVLFIALILRRVFLLESDVSEEYDDVVL